MNRKIVALVVAFTVLAACGAPPAGPVSLTDTAWVLQALRGQPPVAGSTITLEFAADQLGGLAGCNHYGGPYAARADRLTVGEMIRTLMYCDPPGVMRQEDDYLDALSSAARYRVAAGRLELLDDTGQVVLSFTPAPPAPTAALEGAEWVLTTLLDGETAASLLNGTAITLRLENGTASGSAGCNTYTGPYTRQGAALGVGPVASTRMYCQDPAGVMEQEANYLDLLGRVTSFTLNGDRLTLRTADGDGLVFQAR